MSQKRPVQTKALSAYLVAHHKSLSASVQILGLDQDVIAAETISDDVVGRIARLLSLTPEQLAENTAPFATP